MLFNITVLFIFFSVTVSLSLFDRCQSMTSRISRGCTNMMVKNEKKKKKKDPKPPATSVVPGQNSPSRVDKQITNFRGTTTVLRYSSSILFIL